MPNHRRYARGRIEGGFARNGGHRDQLCCRWGFRLPGQGLASLPNMAAHIKPGRVDASALARHLASALVPTRNPGSRGPPLGKPGRESVPATIRVAPKIPKGASLEELRTKKPPSLAVFDGLRSSRGALLISLLCALFILPGQNIVTSDGTPKDAHGARPNDLKPSKAASGRDFLRASAHARGARAPRPPDLEGSGALHDAAGTTP